jgi:hypothetical protein
MRKRGSFAIALFTAVVISHASASAQAIKRLQAENQYIRGVHARKGVLPESYSDPYYTNILVAAATEFEANPTAPHFEVFLASSFNVGSQFSIMLSRYASRYPEILRKVARSPNPYTRTNALGVAILSIQDQPLSSPHRQAMINFVRSGLCDSHPEVRGAIRHTLWTVAGPDTHQLLLHLRGCLQRNQPRPSRGELNFLAKLINSHKSSL